MQGKYAEAKAEFSSTKKNHAAAVKLALALKLKLPIKLRVVLGQAKHKTFSMFGLGK